MKILGIHGFKRTDKVIDFFEGTKRNLEKEGILMENPTFEIGENIDYKNWEKKLDEINIKNYNTILAHSMGCRVAMEYIIERKVKIKKLILIAPAIKINTKEVGAFYKKMKHEYNEINKFAEELIIVYSNDDETTRVEGVKELLNQIKAKEIELNGYGHFNLEEVKIIEDLILN